MTGRAKGAGEAELIALTVPEARRLLALTFGLSAAQVRYHLHWSLAQAPPGNSQAGTRPATVLHSGPGAPIRLYLRL